MLEIADVVADPGPRARAMQNVDFSWAPHARIGRAAAIGSSTLDGTYPRERRSTSGRRSPPTRLLARPSHPCASRSDGRGRGSRRRCRQRARASSSRNAIGSSETLPLVSTSASTPSSARSASRRWWSGAYGQHDAELGKHRGRPRRDVARGRRGASTIGRGGGEQRPLEIGELDERRCRRPTSRTISANGRSSRRLRARSSATARSSAAGRRGGSRRSP